MYLTGFENDEAYQSYLDMTKRIAIYESGSGSDAADSVVDTINMYKRQRRAPSCSDWSKRTSKIKWDRQRIKKCLDSKNYSENIKS